MAFLKFSRDKRGYEHFYLVEPTTRRGKTRSRVLYFFRTPPNIRVGREPFDEDARRSLQTQNPGVTFDWPSILDTPVPPADVEMWRERRRAEKAAKRGATERKAEHPKDEAPSDTIAASEASIDDNEQSPPAPASDRPQQQPRKRRRRGRRGRSREAESAQPKVLSGAEPGEPQESREHPGDDAPIESHEPSTDQ